MTRNDDRPLARIARGDRAALERIYREHKDRLLTLAFHLTGDRSMAEDVLHDVVVRFARRARKLAPDLDLGGYLVRSCLNRVRDLRRRRAPDAVPGTALDAHPGQVREPDAAAVARDALRQVAHALAPLPEEQRAVVVLRVFGNLPFREIAELTDSSVNTTTSRYRYGLDALRTTFTRDRS